MMLQKTKQSNHKRATKKGFTLIEMLVSTFIFVIIMSAIIVIFSRQTASFSYVQDQQRNIENAQFGMNFMTRILRTSSIAEIRNAGKTLYVYDFSSAEACYRFDMQGGALSVSNIAAIGESLDSCADDGRYTSEYDLTTGFVDGSFVVRKTQRDDPDTDSVYEMQVGLITMNLIVNASPTATSRETVIQTSVSLFDYPGELTF